MPLPIAIFLGALPALIAVALGTLALFGVIRFGAWAIGRLLRSRRPTVPPMGFRRAL